MCEADPEIALKWDGVERSPDAFQFRQVDDLLGFAVQKGLRTQAHPELSKGAVRDVVCAPFLRKSPVSACSL